MSGIEIKTSISGSFFKFKPEIDLTIDEFKDLNVTVLAPDKGWLYIPRHLQRLEDLQWRPLPSERGMSPKQVEDEFLRCVSKSDFLYVADFEGYIGTMMGFEMGHAAAWRIPIFLKEPVKLEEPIDLWWKGIIDQMTIASPAEARRLFIEAREKGEI